MIIIFHKDKKFMSERKWDLLEDQKDDMDGAAIPTPYLQQSSNKHMLLAIVKSKK